ncbi:protein of unknown function (DUF3598) [Fragilaria crotonensis]|nr:protein of unknown function (DUF3598) [Fragilaria crotonensis]
MHKVFHKGRGGCCLELNGLFSYLLQDLKFSAVSMVPCYVYAGKERGHRNKRATFRAVASHFMILVGIGADQYFVDVGIGEPALGPLCYTSDSLGTEQTTAEGMKSRIIPDPQGSWTDKQGKTRRCYLLEWWVEETDETGYWEPRLQWDERDAPLVRASEDCSQYTLQHFQYVIPILMSAKKAPRKGILKGVWTTYDYIGDVIDETVASVNLKYDESNDVIQQTHTIVVGAKRADCATCFDSFETKELPVAQYTPTQLHKTRLGSVGMVNGPTLLRSGTMATELVLSQGDGRVRVVFQHAPVWKAGVEPGSCPPQGLKLFRTLISREALRDEPPTMETEAANPPALGNPILYRGVPPFKWHKQWAGTSWTWGPQTGNRGWKIDQMEEADAWHGRATGDGPNVWNLRLPVES